MTTVAKAKGDEHEKTKRAEMVREVELDRLKRRERAQVVDKIFRLLRTLLFCATAVGIAYFIYRSVDSLAGKDTKINALISGMFSAALDRWAAYAVAAIASSGYFIERGRRKKGIKDRAAYIKELEKRLDPERTSSGLHLDGSPKRKDLEHA